MPGYKEYVWELHCGTDCSFTLFIYSRQELGKALLHCFSSLNEMQGQGGVVLLKDFLFPE
jgi:hypothetical protein